MFTTDRRILIGLATRYPELKLLADAGADAPTLSAHFGVALSLGDVAELVALDPGEIAAFRDALDRTYADIYPYGI